MAKQLTADLDSLPLRARTPRTWAEQVLAGDRLALLNDHAHLEKKAASNALELLHRWPEPVPPENWVKAMTTVARDEVEHLALVTRMISRRGGRLTKNHRNPYANDLRQLVRLGEGTIELMDRLMISALIEARSCERFALLAEVCVDDGGLRKLYDSLWASEHGHYRIFIDLAEQVVAARVVNERWREMLDAEARIIETQMAGPRMHSWPESNSSEGSSLESR